MTSLVGFAVAKDSKTLAEVVMREREVAEREAVEPSGSFWVMVRDTSSMRPDSIMDCLAFSSRYLMASMRIF